MIKLGDTLRNKITSKISVLTGIIPLKNNVKFELDNKERYGIDLMPIWEKIPNRSVNR